MQNIILVFFSQPADSDHTPSQSPKPETPNSNRMTHQHLPRPRQITFHHTIPIHKSSRTDPAPTRPSPSAHAHVSHTLTNPHSPSHQHQQTFSNPLQINVINGAYTTNFGNTIYTLCAEIYMENNVIVQLAAPTHKPRFVLTKQRRE